MHATDPALTWLRAILRDVAASLPPSSAFPATPVAGRHLTRPA